MVVDVVVVGLHLVGDHAEVLAEERVHHLAHGEGHPSELDEALAQLERLTLHALDAPPFVAEEEVLGLLHFLVEEGHGGEVAVHQGVEQTVEQKADAVDGQAR